MFFGFLDIWMWIAAGLLFSMTLRFLWYLPDLQRLPRADDAEVRPELVSVVIAARDEAERIESTVRRVLGLRGVQVEVIVVDDRSVDETSSIIRRLAAEDSRVKLQRVDTLPPEWLGKCHACYLGAAAAAGEWILFTDADCWLKDDVLLRALRLAEQEHADHVTLTPGVAPETAAAAAWHISFLLTVTDWASRVNRDHPRGHFGIGAFNLVRKSAYDACGGYEKLRLTVVDDIKLGLLLRRAGFRTRAFIGGDDAECHWGRTVPGMIRIMEKNYFAAADYRTGLVAGVTAFSMLGSGALLAAPFASPVPALAIVLATMSLWIPASIAAKRLRWSAGRALLVPLILPVLFYSILNSAIVTLRQGGIRWRDTFYPLAMLRRGNVR